MTTQQDSHIELSFNRFRAADNAASPPLLLLVDCETRRFTIEHPATRESFRDWCSEVEHAVAVGRHIVGVPIHNKSTSEIESLGHNLGYALWPSRTILLPRLSDEQKAPPLVADSNGTDDEQRLRLLARLSAAS